MTKPIDVASSVERQTQLDDEDEKRTFFSPKRKFFCVSLLFLLVLALMLFRNTQTNNNNAQTTIVLDLTTEDDEENDDEEEDATEDEYYDEKQGLENQEGDDDDDYAPGFQESAAPRSMPELEYNEFLPQQYKYMLYNPSGGMSNQLMALENAILLARMLGRTLYISRIASHSNFIQGYLSQGYARTFPADQLLDFQMLTNFSRVIPLNLTTTDFAKQFPGSMEYIHSDYASFGFPVSYLKALSHDLLYFSGKRMWKSWFPTRIMDEARHVLAYSPHLRRMSMNIAKAELGPVFYAIHGRLGDEAYKWGSRTSRVFMNQRFRAWDKEKFLFLASDDPLNEFFDPLKRAMKVKSLRDMGSSVALKEFASLFPSEKVRNDMLGVLDKLICIQATDFIGTKFSTFTWDIERSRRQREVLFPELFV